MGKTAVYMGADTFAFFTRNPRGGKAKEIKPEDVEKYKKIAKEYQFGKIEMIWSAWSISRGIIIISIRGAMWGRGPRWGSRRSLRS